MSALDIGAGPPSAMEGVDRARGLTQTLGRLFGICVLTQAGSVSPLDANADADVHIFGFS